MSDMGYRVQGEWRWKIPWRRKMRVRETKEVGELLTRLSKVSPSEGRVDCWA